MISHIFAIQSRGSADGARCTTSSAQVTCCDRTDIDRFDLPINFIFGVTESAQGNTAGASLLGFHDSLPEYQADVVLLNRAEVSQRLSVGSTIPSRSTATRGIRMLWFAIGEWSLA